MQKTQSSPHLRLSACLMSLPMLAAGAEEWWRRRQRLAQLLLALIIPKDQFSDHYLLSHTCRHTYITGPERIYKLPSEESLSKHRHHLL